jgi:hypothetical protein
MKEGALAVFDVGCRIKRVGPFEFEGGGGPFDPLAFADNLYFGAWGAVMRKLMGANNRLGSSWVRV